MNGTYTVENILLQTQPHKPMDCAEGYKVASAVDCIVLLPLFTEYRIMEFRYNFHDSTFFGIFATAMVVISRISFRFLTL